MAYVFCNQCGHRNPPESGFCSSCGSVLDRIADHTITLAKVDPLLDADLTVTALDDMIAVRAIAVEAIPPFDAAIGFDAGNAFWIFSGCHSLRLWPRFQHVSGVVHEDHR